MKDVHVKVDQNDLSSFRTGRVDTDRVDATTDNDIQEQIEIGEVHQPLLEALPGIRHG